MKAVILAAGYATRLYPLTKDKPKALLEIAGKTILSHILDKIELVGKIDSVFIVTNDKFYKSFADYTDMYVYSKPVTVISDGTSDNDNRLGAIADIDFIIKSLKINDDILILASDNLFEFNLTTFVEFYENTAKDCITAHAVEKTEDLKKTGVIDVDKNGRVLSFVEKPSIPKSNLAVPPIYIYKRDTIPLISQYLREGNNPDSPGNFIPWLIKRKNVSAFIFEGRRYDIGSMESYIEAQQVFCRRGNNETRAVVVE